MVPQKPLLSLGFGMGDSTPKSDDQISKGFKKCEDCGRCCLSQTDPHQSCFKCLGIDHMMDDCQACLQFEPQVQRTRFIRHLLWKKRTDASEVNPPPPKSDFTLTNVKTELEQLGVTQEEWDFYSNLKNYNKVIDSGDNQSASEEENMEGDFSMDDPLERGSKVSKVLDGSMGPTLERASMESGQSGESDNLLFGGRTTTSALTTRTTCKGSRFGQLRSLKKPSSLGALEAPHTSRGVEFPVEGRDSGISTQLDKIANIMTGFHNRLETMESA